MEQNEFDSLSNFEKNNLLTNNTRVIIYPTDFFIDYKNNYSDLGELIVSYTFRDIFASDNSTRDGYTQGIGYTGYQNLLDISFNTDNVDLFNAVLLQIFPPTSDMTFDSWVELYLFDIERNMPQFTNVFDTFSMTQTDVNTTWNNFVLDGSNIGTSEAFCQIEECDLTDVMCGVQKAMCWLFVGDYETSINDLKNT